MAAPRWASLDRSCDPVLQYGIKLRADHGGSSPGGVKRVCWRAGPRLFPELLPHRSGPRSRSVGRGGVPTDRPSLRPSYATVTPAQHVTVNVTGSTSSVLSRPGATGFGGTVRLKDTVVEVTRQSAAQAIFGAKMALFYWIFLQNRRLRRAETVSANVPFPLRPRWPANVRSGWQPSERGAYRSSGLPLCSPSDPAPPVPDALVCVSCGPGETVREALGGVLWMLLMIFTLESTRCHLLVHRQRNRRFPCFDVCLSRNRRLGGCRQSRSRELGRFLCGAATLEVNLRRAHLVGL